nr:uncharacterized protein LOC112544267 [Pelodiscus sinensis]|eukprot:XP_025035948.1 uncharacterized protein LOC112544267 [Pelodiscus sinensis]
MSDTPKERPVSFGCLSADAGSESATRCQEYFSGSISSRSRRKALRPNTQSHSQTCCWNQSRWDRRRCCYRPRVKHAHNADSRGPPAPPRGTTPSLLPQTRDLPTLQLPSAQLRQLGQLQARRGPHLPRHLPSSTGSTGGRKPRKTCCMSRRVASSPLSGGMTRSARSGPLTRRNDRLTGSSRRLPGTSWHEGTRSSLSVVVESVTS